MEHKYILSSMPDSFLLQGGFLLIKNPERKVQILHSLSNNMIIFVLEGSITISSLHNPPKAICEKYMVFMQKYEEYTYELAPHSTVIIFTFDSASMDELTEFRIKYGMLGPSEYKYTELQIVGPVVAFLQLLREYYENNYKNYDLYLTKKKELFHILKNTYSPKVLGEFLCSLLKSPTPFEKEVIANYENAKTVKELANRLGYGVSSFRTKFKNSFNMAAYKWMMREKAKRILKYLSTQNCTYAEMIDQFGFCSHSHFYKFCKAYYKTTPEELRRMLNL